MIFFDGAGNREVVDAAQVDGRWVSERPLAEGESAYVPSGCVKDGYGNVNGTGTTAVGASTDVPAGDLGCAATPPPDPDPDPDPDPTTDPPPAGTDPAPAETSPAGDGGGEASPLPAPGPEPGGLPARHEARRQAEGHRGRRLPRRWPWQRPPEGRARATTGSSAAPATTA